MDGVMSVIRKSISPVLVISGISVFAINQNQNSAKPVKMERTGKSIYENKCGTCHKLFAPDKYDAKGWKKWVDKMAPKAKLTAEEKGKVYKYLSTAKKK